MFWFMVRVDALENGMQWYLIDNYTESTARTKLSCSYVNVVLVRFKTPYIPVFPLAGHNFVPI